MEEPIYECMNAFEYIEIDWTVCALCMYLPTILMMWFKYEDKKYKFLHKCGLFDLCLPQQMCKLCMKATKPNCLSKV